MFQFVFSLLAAVRVFFSTRRDTALEVLALRQQLAVLKRKRPRPPLSSCDRHFWTTRRRLWPRWADLLVIVSRKPSSPGTKRTHVRARWQNGVAERWVGSRRREILDHVIAERTASQKASAKKGGPKVKKADKPTRRVPRARVRRFWTSSGGPKELLQRHRETGRFDMADAGGTSPSRN